MKRHWLAFGLLALALAAPALADDPTPAQPDNSAQMAQGTPMAEHVVMPVKDMKWMDGPDGLPKGAKFVVLNGNPGGPGLFTIRAMLPAGYKVPAHFHATDENITVISGEFGIGMGEALDMAKGTVLSAGGFTAMPAGMHHFAWTKKGATIQIHGMGPFSITYINPTDDPRNAKEAAK
jgi:uncharacterized RmlC-like cupin family protein